jgi:hypothetical protein
MQDATRTIEPDQLRRPPCCEKRDDAMLTKFMQAGRQQISIGLFDYRGRLI